MKEKVYLSILFHCVIFSKGIVGAFSEDEIEESSNILVREKRVINRVPGEDVPVMTGDMPYVVSIKKNDRLHCVGTILSYHTVITAARCITNELSQYGIFSGSKFSYSGQHHEISEIKLRSHSPSRSATFMTGIVLLTVYPRFVYSNAISKLELHTGPVLAGMQGTVSGWGSYCYGGPRETAHPRSLRSIIVPIINHRDCVNIYRDFFEIKDEDICTHHAQKQCGHTDTGAPLVIDNELVGVHIGGIETAGRELPIKPDVFILLQDSNYGQWIRRNIV